jgi:membrane-associated protease RseP (regulator of RpoE activity)
VRLTCYRTMRVEELLNVDLLDRAPKRLGPFRLERAEGTLAPAGLDGATLSVDGTAVGVLPVAPFAACAGSRHLEAVRQGRRLWAGEVEVHEGEPQAVPLTPRPNLVVVGTEAPPWAEAWNVELRESGKPPTDGWPADVDLVLGDPVWSPALGASVDLPQDDPLLKGPPARGRKTLGVALADGEGWGAARIVRLRADGPAARAGVRLGERIVAVSGKQVRSSAEVDTLLAAAPEGALELTLEAGAGETRKVSATPARSPVLAPLPGNGAQAALRAAWAAAEVTARPDDVAAAADLVLALVAGNRLQAATAAARERTWPARPGISQATVDYFLGRALQAAGNGSEAATLLHAAAASKATAESDDGPLLAPAAKSP